MWHVQEHYNLYTQPLINLVSAHILGRVRFCLKFYIILCIFFYKIKTKEHPNLHDTTFLVLFRVYVGENSRTFQDLIVEFKDFSRIYSKIQGLFKTVRTLMSAYVRVFGLHFLSETLCFCLLSAEKMERELWNVNWYLTFKENDSSNWGKHCFRKVTLVCYDFLMSICILVVNHWNSLFAPHRWNFSRQEYVLQSTFYI